MMANAPIIHCCLKRCPLGGNIGATDGRTDVRGFSVKSSQEFLARWEEDGGAAFHMDCFAKLCALAEGSEVTAMSSVERKLVNESLETAEYHESLASQKAAAMRVATMIKESSYPIVFTGAGISTSAGIGDFRGIHGKWTDRDKQKDHGAQKPSKKGRARVNMMDLRPTYTHEALVKLTEMGHLKYLISQNTDGLHRLSGIPEGSIAELHGNAFTEKCERCEKRYTWNFGHRSGPKVASVPPRKCDHCRINHRTGRICPDAKCKGYLMNTIINFGDNLESPVLESAVDNAKQADMVLVLGSTLKVSPANSLVTMGQRPVRLVICNRQTTPYDHKCQTKDTSAAVQHGCRVFGDCDDLMREVMKQVLDAGTLKEWESGRNERMKTYNASRQ